MSYNPHTGEYTGDPKEADDQFIQQNQQLFNSLVEEYKEIILAVVARQGGASSTGIREDDIIRMGKSASGVTDGVKLSAFHEALDRLKKEGTLVPGNHDNEWKLTGESLAQGKELRREAINEANKNCEDGRDRSVDRILDP